MEVPSLVVIVGICVLLIFLIVEPGPVGMDCAKGGVSFLFARVWMPEPPNGCEIHANEKL
jgi:hypothetical protein